MGGWGSRGPTRIKSVSNYHFLTAATWTPTCCLYKRCVLCSISLCKELVPISMFPPTKVLKVLKGMKDIRTRSSQSLLLLLLLRRFSRVRLCATPQTAAHQAPPSLGFSRQEHWSGLPFPSPMHESEKSKWSCFYSLINLTLIFIFFNPHHNIVCNFYLEYR